MRDQPDFLPSLRLRNGYPQLDQQFLANVAHSGHADCIVPFPIAASGAAQFVTGRGVAFDAAYIDAGHDYPSVRADLAAFWPLVRTGGVMFGDDFVPAWHGVVRAVSEFAEVRGCRLYLAAAGEWAISRAD